MDEALSYPPQKRNGGSPPALLSSPSLSHPSWWPQVKWLQPPPRAPDCAAALCQRLHLLSESVDERERQAELAAQRKQAAARVIFLWLRRRRHFARLARQTSRRLQLEAALARMQANAERRCREAAAASAAFDAAMAKLATAERHRHAAVLAAEADV